MMVEDIVYYLRQHSLLLATAESCTAGRIVALLAEVPGSGSLVECGYVVYSPQAKQRLLGVRAKTIEHFNLTSLEVAREMAAGALHDSPATVAIATTGLCGNEDVDGIPAGTVCFAWGFRHDGRTTVFARKERFFGDRKAMQQMAALHALKLLPHFHQRMLGGEAS
ncbi:amidohydrolase, PncC family [Pseudomonas sp. NFACC02]|uniref:CinA family protein n=1 Tax=Pseudomonas TaxID=286 RepID=UPI0007802D03|nr:MULTISPECIES: CinA family protein [Pseudomonas]SEP96318.1 amidohydrolase, PncC family [Pseudomonas sp. NFACC02]